MYFYGQDYEDDYTADIFFLIEQLSPEEITELKTLAQANSEFKVLVGEIQGNPELENDRDTIFTIIENINLFLKPMSNQITQALEIRSSLEELVGIKKNSDIG